ncbi:MAG: formylglycine-generating enzyme family protein, partial [Terracidiphilus sp.]
ATGQENEQPVHRVWLDEFALAECQVTREEYARLLAATGAAAPPQWSHPDFSHPKQPVVAISWFDAVAYFSWLIGNTGRHFRLPTEAEWERAARGGLEQNEYPWGNAHPESLDNYAVRWKTGPEQVGVAERNGYGLCDIGANVHEWCADWFSPEYYALSTDRNPQGPSAGTRRASRGGSWRHYTKVSRCAVRSSIPPEFQYADYGFRVACDAVKDI